MYSASMTFSPSWINKGLLMGCKFCRKGLVIVNRAMCESLGPKNVVLKPSSHVVFHALPFPSMFYLEESDSNDMSIVELRGL